MITGWDVAVRGPGNKKSGPKAAARHACRCTNRPFSRISKVKIECGRNSRETTKKDSGTGLGPFQNPVTPRFEIKSILRRGRCCVGSPERCQLPARVRLQ